MKLTEVDEYFRTSLYEMSNFKSDKTGLPNGIQLWVRTEPIGLPHTKYRIKFDHSQKGSAVFGIWGDGAVQVAGNWEVTGEELKKIKVFVATLAEPLRKHIDGEYDSDDLGSSIRSAKLKVVLVQ